MLRIEIRRKSASLQPKRRPSDLPAWGNNDFNNSLDDFILFLEAIVIFTAKVQSVANLEGLSDGAKYTDTVAPGSFDLITDVERRDFWPRIHGIANATTLAGEKIGADSTSPTNPARWLVHDWQKHRSKAPEGTDTRVAWSAGCFVLSDRDLVRFGELLDNNKLNPGAKIPGTVILVA